MVLGNAVPCFFFQFKKYDKFQCSSLDDYQFFCDLAIKWDVKVTFRLIKEL